MTWVPQEPRLTDFRRWGGIPAKQNSLYAFPSRKRSIMYRTEAETCKLWPLVIFSAAVDFRTEIIDVSKVNTLPGRMLLIGRKKSKGKYQNGSLTSPDGPKKLARKSHILTLYLAPRDR